MIFPGTFWFNMIETNKKHRIISRDLWLHGIGFIDADELCATRTIDQVRLLMFTSPVLRIPVMFWPLGPRVVVPGICQTISTFQAGPACHWLRPDINP